MIEGPKKKQPSRREKKDNETRDSKHNFSGTNNGEMTNQWMGAINKRKDTLSAIYVRASGVKPKPSDSDIDGGSENGRADIESETEDSGNDSEEGEDGEGSKGSEDASE